MTSCGWLTCRYWVAWPAENGCSPAPGWDRRVPSRANASAAPPPLWAPFAELAGSWRSCYPAAHPNWWSRRPYCRLPAAWAADWWAVVVAHSQWCWWWAWSSPLLWRKLCKISQSAERQWRRQRTLDHKGMHLINIIPFFFSIII